jgi:hypothetical protein
MIGKSGMSLAYSSVAAVILLGGCSLVYDTGDLRAGRDGGMSADADPDALFVQRVTPDSVFEGEGSSFDDHDDMVRAIPIVLEGQNMTAETVFTIEGLGLDGTIDDVAVSGDGHFAAFALSVPILGSLGDGMEDHFTIHLAKGDEEFTAPLLRVNGLDALVRTDGESLHTDELHGMYTSVELVGTVSASGDAPLRVAATAGIKLAGALHADAGAAPTAGPGGCAGGARHAASACGQGSGKAGETSASPGGGGGGGYGTDGTDGSGGDGQAGNRTGQTSLVQLPPADGATAHGAGGGGGGDLTLDANTAGRGGGSGGVVELTTPAVFTMTASAVISAGGGDGQTAVCTTGGGGGGGSGGAILLRAGVMLAAAGASAVAPGGFGQGSQAGCRGGDGGAGRIRIDRGNDATIEADPATFMGPIPVTDLPVIVSEANPEVTVRGAASEEYELYVGDQETPTTFGTEADGLGSPHPTLEPGLNRLCVYVTAKTELDYPESKNCVDVAYIKP